MLTSPSPAFPGLAGILPGGGVAGQALVCAPGSMSGAAWESIPGVPATRFGVVADGPTDAASLARNTVALQEFVDYIQTHHRSGLLPDGTIHINAPVDFSSTYYWAVRGGGRGLSCLAPRGVRALGGGGAGRVFAELNCASARAQRHGCAPRLRQGRNRGRRGRSRPRRGAGAAPPPEDIFGKRKGWVSSSGR